VNEEIWKRLQTWPDLSPISSNGWNLTSQQYSTKCGVLRTNSVCSRWDRPMRHIVLSEQSLPITAYSCAYGSHCPRRRNTSNDWESVSSQPPLAKVSETGLNCDLEEAMRSLVQKKRNGERWSKAIAKSCLITNWWSCTLSHASGASNFFWL
jgi:hypothetical protein